MWGGYLRKCPPLEFVRLFNVALIQYNLGNCIVLMKGILITETISDEKNE